MLQLGGGLVQTPPHLAEKEFVSHPPDGVRFSVAEARRNYDQDRGSSLPHVTPRRDSTPTASEEQISDNLPPSSFVQTAPERAGAAPVLVAGADDIGLHLNTGSSGNYAEPSSLLSVAQQQEDRAAVEAARAADFAGGQDVVQIVSLEPLGASGAGGVPGGLPLPPAGAGGYESSDPLSNLAALPAELEVAMEQQVMQQREAEQMEQQEMSWMALTALSKLMELSTIVIEDETASSQQGAQVVPGEMLVTTTDGLQSRDFLPVVSDVDVVQFYRNLGASSSTDSLIASLQEQETCMDRKMKLQQIPHKGKAKELKWSSNGRCGPQFGDTACKTGCCSAFGWCGSGHDWCDCGVCQAEFGRCGQTSWQQYEIGENLCMLPDHLEQAVYELFQKNAGSDDVAAKNLQTTLQQIHRSMPHASFEQLYYGFECLLENVDEKLTLSKIEKMLAVVSKKASYKQVIDTTVLLRNFPDVSNGQSASLEYAWIYLLAFQSALSEPQRAGQAASSGEFVSTALFLSAIQNHLTSRQRSGTSTASWFGGSSSASAAGTSGPTLQLLLTELTKVVQRFPQNTLSDIDRAYTELRLVYDNVDFLGFAAALEVLIPMRKTEPLSAAMRARAASTVAPALPPGDVERYSQAFQRLKSRCYLDPKEEVKTIADNVVLLKKIFHEGDEDPVKVLGALGDLMEQFHLTKSGSVTATLQEGKMAERVFGSAGDNSFSAVARYLTQVRMLYISRGGVFSSSPPTLEQCLELSAVFLHEKGNQIPDRRNLDVVLQKMQEVGPPNFDPAALQKEVEKETAAGSADEASSTSLGSFFVTAAKPAEQADAASVGDAVQQLVQAYGVTVQQAKHSLLRLGNRWKGLNLDEVVKFLLDFQAANGRKYSLSVIVSSLDALARFSDAAPLRDGGRDESRTRGSTDGGSSSSSSAAVDADALPPTFGQCGEVLIDMAKQLESSDELHAVAVDFSSLKVALEDAADAASTDGRNGLQAVWGVFVLLKNEFAEGEQPSSWKQVADDVHKLLLKFRHTQNLHRLYALLTGLKEAYNDKLSLTAITDILLTFEREFPELCKEQDGALEWFLDFLIRIKAVDFIPAEEMVSMDSKSQLLTTVEAVVEMKAFGKRFATAKDFFATLLEAVQVLEPAFGPAGRIWTLSSATGSPLTFSQLAASFARFHADFLLVAQEVTLHDLIMALKRLHDYFYQSSLPAILTSLGRLPGLFPELNLHQLIEEIAEVKSTVPDLTVLVETLAQWKQKEPLLSWRTARERYAQEHTTAGGTLCSWLLISTGVLFLLCVSQDHLRTRKQRGRFSNHADAYGAIPPEDSTVAATTTTATASYLKPGASLLDRFAAKFLGAGSYALGNGRSGGLETSTTTTGGGGSKKTIVHVSTSKQTLEQQARQSGSKSSPLQRRSKQSTANTSDVPDPFATTSSKGSNSTATVQQKLDFEMDDILG
ncbi:unnamed protein product [Amoebophrya sp. A120]|nr:unnamed protein product [Amoebophrya sp. A120]|eukprot:GSA120T00006559001.1